MTIRIKRNLGFSRWHIFIALSVLLTVSKIPAFAKYLTQSFKYRGLAQVCSNKPNPKAAAPQSNQQAMAGFDDGSIAMQFIPAELQSSGLADTQWVVCMDAPKTPTVQSCSYTGGHRLNRKIEERKIQIIEAMTGKVVDSTVLQAQFAPEACPGSARLSGPSSDEIIGTVTESQVQSWIVESSRAAKH